MSRLDSLDVHHLTALEDLSCVDGLTAIAGMSLVTYEECTYRPNCRGCPAHIDEYSDRLKKLLTLQGGEPDE